MKKIAILGITGSIGTSACEVIREQKEDFQIVLASAHHNLDSALSLANEFSIPKLVVIKKQKVTDVPAQTDLYFGSENLESLLRETECDIVLNAVSGSAGLPYSIIALESNRKLALANKESLIMAGHLMTKLAADNQASIIPVDSEHSAIMQAIGSNSIEEVKKIILTASGGPFRKLPLKDFKSISLEDSLQHPTWNMGAKITIDSATMMNKGLEVIEAHWLFKLDYEKISAVIHPQSIIHSLVEFVDGSLVAQLSEPTMKLPILHALAYPHHQRSNLCSTDLLNLPPLTFESIPQEKYPLFYSALEAGKQGGLAPTILNAANEEAVAAFLAGRLGFTRIADVIEAALERASGLSVETVEAVLEADRHARSIARSEILSRQS